VKFDLFTIVAGENALYVGVVDLIQAERVDGDATITTQVEQI